MNKARRTILIIFITLLFVGVVIGGTVILSSCNNYQEPKTYTVIYETDGNGTLSGKSIRTVNEGETSVITAIPNKGYRFVMWSDGVYTAKRRDYRISENIQVTAIFELITNYYWFDYKDATGNCELRGIELTYGQLSDLSLTVPTRERCRFGGWYADKEYNIKVTDETGRFVIDDEEFFSLDCVRLYAKWKPDNDFTYKILLVYVTEINAELTKKDRTGTKQVNYKMTETEHRICQMTTEKISEKLNNLYLTNFQVDEYFTKIPLTKDNLSVGSSGNLVENFIFAYDIPEVYNLLNEYQSVLVVFSLNDYDLELSNGGGSAGAKYGSIHLDSILAQLILDRLPFYVLLTDMENKVWDSILNTIIHEFAHTIEQRVSTFNWHTVEALYHEDAYALYFSNEAIVNGEKVGVPYEFWEGKVANVYYEVVDNGGYIEFDYSEGKFNVSWLAEYEGKSARGNLQHVIYGYDAARVTAVPLPGYEFIGWSDGVTEASRKDINLTSDLHVKALFRRKSE